MARRAPPRRTSPIAYRRHLHRSLPPKSRSCTGAWSSICCGMRNKASKSKVWSCAGLLPPGVHALAPDSSGRRSRIAPGGAWYRCPRCPGRHSACASLLDTLPALHDSQVAWLLLPRRVAPLALRCSLQDEPRSAPTLSCASLAAAGSPSLSVEAATFVRQLARCKARSASPLSRAAAISAFTAPSQQAFCRSRSPAPRMSMGSCPH